MTIGEMQETVDRWIREVGKGYFPPLANMAVLTEEVGELARVIVRQYGPQVAKASDMDRNLEEELADVLWVVVCLANQTGVDLTEAFRKTLKKKTERDRDRFSQ
ncbi:MAG: nucleotide pyrophosphohydrolase [Muribaculaceae bacterium]|nr:nucleotide pyrophosphohydrolase [Muribaculaceae bacterium]